MIEAEAMDGAREGEVGGNIRLDPFLQLPILKAFFEVLPLEELATCRLVCKLWKKESLSTWRSNVTLNLGKEGLVSTRYDGSKRITSLENFLDLWDTGDWDFCPFRKFKLNRWNFIAENKVQEWFLELVGGNITSLILDGCTFVERDNFRRIIYQSFPNLKFLKMNQCNVGNHHGPTEEILAYHEPTFGVHGLSSLEINSCHPLPESMMDMLSHFHKIKSLNLSGVDLDYRNLLEVIRLIRVQDQTKLPLKNFHVAFRSNPQTTALSTELLKLHEQLNLPLPGLKIYFHQDPDCNFNDAIRSVLQKHSSTLKYLEFARGDEDRHGLCKSFLFGFRFENLECLTIRSRCFMNSLNFLRYTPNLRILVFEVSSSFSLAEADNLFSNSTQLEIEDWRLPALTTLKFDLPLSVGNLRKLMKWMPNVGRLYGIRLDDVKFSMICGNENWRKLNYLSDLGEELTDEGVIGIETVGNQETQICPNITKLKNLTTFWTRSPNLTSASVYEGFLKLANLEFLALGHGTKLDDEAIAALKGQKTRLDTSPRNRRDYIKLAFILLLALFFWFYLK